MAEICSEEILWIQVKLLKWLKSVICIVHMKSLGHSMYWSYPLCIFMSVSLEYRATPAKQTVFVPHGVANCIELYPPCCSMHLQGHKALNPSTKCMLVFILPRRKTDITEKNSLFSSIQLSTSYVPLYT